MCIFLRAELSFFLEETVEDFFEWCEEVAEALKENYE